MPSRVVRQPNGLWAVFSSVVDTFTHYDATEAEMLDHWRGEVGDRVARQKMGDGLADRTFSAEDMTATDGLNRFREAIDTIRTLQGDEEADRWVALLSKAPEEAQP